MATNTAPLSIIAPLLHCNLADDGFGNLVIVSGAAWASAHYYAHSI
jgi:hypothetical protein